MSLMDLDPGGIFGGALFARLMRNEANEPELPRGTKLGSWCLGSLIGRGGSSLVYLAHRTGSHYVQQAAIKVLRNEVPSAGTNGEQAMLSALWHPCIASLLDGGETPEGRHWFALEPVFGENIDDHVRSQRSCWQERLRLFLAICDAVAHIHSRQIVHRDIKPANIRVDAHGVPKLLDFGAALSGGVRSRSAPQAYTPGHASPEQLRGERVTVASDVFQLGQLLQSLFFDGAFEPDCSLPSLRRSVRRDIVAVFNKACSPDPRHRYASVRDLSSDIEAVLSRRPLRAREGSMIHNVFRYLERNWMPMSLTVTGCCSLALTLATVVG